MVSGGGSSMRAVPGRATGGLSDGGMRAGGTSVSAECAFSGGKSCAEVQCCAGLATRDCVSIEDEKSRSLSERCETFLTIGANGGRTPGGSVAVVDAEGGGGEDAGTGVDDGALATGLGATGGGAGGGDC